MAGIERHIELHVNGETDGQSLLSWSSISTAAAQADFSEGETCQQQGGRMEKLNVGRKSRLMRGALVTDGVTSVDGCFNFSLPLSILPLL